MIVHPPTNCLPLKLSGVFIHDEDDAGKLSAPARIVNLCGCSNLPALLAEDEGDSLSGDRRGMSYVRSSLWSGTVM